MRPLLPVFTISLPYAEIVPSLGALDFALVVHEALSGLPPLSRTVLLGGAPEAPIRTPFDGPWVQAVDTGRALRHSRFNIYLPNVFVTDVVSEITSPNGRKLADFDIAPLWCAKY